MTTVTPVAALPAVDASPGSHFQLEPAWSHLSYPTIANLAHVFSEPVRVVRGGAWLAGDEIEYLADSSTIPLNLLDAVLGHLAEVHERKHGWMDVVPASLVPVTFAAAITWLYGTERDGVWTKFTQQFVAEPTGGYRALGIYQGATTERVNR